LNRSSNGRGGASSGQLLVVVFSPSLFSFSAFQVHSLYGIVLADAPEIDTNKKKATRIDRWKGSKE
jgi:hypothetical protein